jgi:outer membrane protein insertion porin family
VKASVGASFSGQTFDFSFTEPHFLGLNISSGIDVYHHIGNETTINYYGTTSTGGQVRVGLPVTRDLSTSLFVGFDQTTINDVSSPYTQLFCSPTPCADGLTFNKAWAGVSATYSALDDTKHPTNGLYATASTQYVGLSYNYVRSEAKARYFFPLVSDYGIIGSIKGQAGIINDFSGGGVSPLETFSSPGTLVRGLVNGDSGPRYSDGEVLGYTAYAGVSAEIKFPVPGLPENYGLSGAIWGDAAVIAPSTGWLPSAANSTQPFKSSVGASIIWDSPFGPLRGDAAYVLTKAPADNTQIFSLTLNTLL